MSRSLQTPHRCPLHVSGESGSTALFPEFVSGRLPEFGWERVFFLRFPGYKQGFLRDCLDKSLTEEEEVGNHGHCLEGVEIPGC